MASSPSRKDKAALVQKREALFEVANRRAGAFTMIQPQRTGKVTSAALTTISDRKDSKAGSSKSSDRSWQRRSYDLLDEVGELGYLLELKSQLVARCNLQLQWMNDEGVWDAPPEDEKRPARVMHAFVGPQGGQTELKRQAALHLSAAGEAHLLGSPLEDGGILWEFLSVDELQIGVDGTVTRSRSRGAQSESIDPDTHYIARLWRPSARRSDEPDCEVKRVLRIAEEILTLTQMVDAIARSRLAAGMLFVPDEISFDDDEPDEVAEQSDQPDPLTSALLEHMSAPVQDRENAASLVPLVMRGPAEMGDKIRLIDLARDLDTWAQSLREEALSRLAQGLDAPPEMMTGIGATNHWSGFQIDADFASKHVAPLGQMLAEFVTFAYLRPMLTTFEGVDQAEAERFRLQFDLSPIAARADEAASAARLHTSTLLSDEALVRSSGFDQAAMPGEDEKHQRRMWDLIQRAPQLFAPVFLNQIEGFEDVDMEALQSAASGGQENDSAEMLGEQPSENSPESRTNDAQSGQEIPRTPIPGFSNLIRTIAVSADSALDRALEKAGARLVTKASKDPELRDRLRAAPKHQALELVNSSELVRVNVDYDSLFAEAWSQFAPKCRLWIAEHLVDQGVDQMTADDRAALATSSVCDALDGYIAEHAGTGFRVGPNRLKVPDALVLRAMGPVSTHASAGR